MVEIPPNTMHSGKLNSSSKEKEKLHPELTSSSVDTVKNVKLSQRKLPLDTGSGFTTWKSLEMPKAELQKRGQGLDPFPPPGSPRAAGPERRSPLAPAAGPRTPVKGSTGLAESQTPVPSLPFLLAALAPRSRAAAPAATGTPHFGR